MNDSKNIKQDNLFETANSYDPQKKQQTKNKSLYEIMKNFRDYDQSQPYYGIFDFKRFLREDHPAKIIDIVIERLDLTTIYLAYNKEGNPPYHPKMMLKVLFYGYYRGVMSCRKLWDEVMFRSDFIYLAAGQVPNFRTINSFRLRHLDHLSELFAQIVFLCVELDMVDFKNLAIDGEMIKANASYRKSKNLKGIGKEIEKVERGLKKLLEKEVTEDFPDELKNIRLERVKNKLKKLEEMEQILKTHVEEKKNTENKTGNSTKKQAKCKNEIRLNLTDIDAKVLHHKDGRKLPSYNHQSASDGKFGVVCAIATLQRQDCPKDLYSLVDMANTFTASLFGNVLADSAFGSHTNYVLAEKRKEEYYVPDKWFQAKKAGTIKNEYSREFFTKTEDGGYVCPAGNKMEYKYQSKSHNNVYDVYAGVGCASCINKEKCTTSKVRTLSVDTRIEYQEKMRTKLESDRGREIYMKRQSIAESVHGDDQKNRGWIQHHLRGLRKAAAEFALMRIGTNIRKIVKYRTQEVLALT